MRISSTFSKVEKARDDYLERKIRALYNKVLGRKLGETCQKVRFCFVSWVEYYRTKFENKAISKRSLFVKAQAWKYEIIIRFWKIFLSI